MRRALVLILCGSALAGCATASKPAAPAALRSATTPPPVAAQAPAAAVGAPPEAERSIVVAMAPIPNPPERDVSRASPARPSTPPVPIGDPAAQVARANAAARVHPTSDAYDNATQVYTYEEGALFQVYTSPGQVTDIVLQEGETLSGTGPVAAGDTTRWVIGDTESGSGASRRVHILVKPTRANLQTNLVINTYRRTYHLELRATPATYMAAVSWRYPRDEAAAAAAALAAEQQAIPAVSVETLNFNYQIAGDRPDWRPTRVFDDGRQTVIEFPATVSQSEMPPLFVGKGRGRPVELVNYRVQGQRIVVDRIFDSAELRLGQGRRPQQVRIERVGGR